MIKRHKNDLILTGIIILAGLVTAALVLLTRPTGSTVSVRVDGKEIASFSLDEDRELYIPGKGGSNQLVIRGGYAWMSEADCPDGLCVGMGKINRAGQSIICLPHKVVIQIEGPKESGTETIDFTTG